MTRPADWQSTDGAIRLYCGDAVELFPVIRPGVAAVVSDPPYGMKNNNDYRRFTGGTHGPTSQRNYPPTANDDKPFDPTPWLNFPKVILWGSNHYAARLPVGATLVWIKKNDPAFGKFLSDAEIAWQKGGKGVFCRRDTSLNSLQKKNRVHPNQKPVTIMDWCLDRVKVGYGNVILDPYTGSGTTGVACVRRGCRFVGVEYTREYFDIAVSRIESELTAFSFLN